ncbi:hypothetical protein TW83_08085 [Paracoccus sp. S4493]|uniref:hypothetical protein n=1 Tax=Paracoccus sp. S4493 TaxID=579490 RepID=UPI0005FA4CD7|nr:hypothetical protein [Paracoccus sp. S4493]KJZ31606.1 hypothetical protein TW83_08085 [Paracoccus sp. S4493]
MSQVPSLGDSISASVAAMLTPEYIEKEVETRVAKLVTEGVDRALRSYSDTGKLIEKAVEDALRVNNLDLPNYGSTVANILKAQIEANVSELVAGRLSQDMEELLTLAPKEIKLSQIAKEMLEKHESDGAYGEVITVIIDKGSYGSTWIYLDEDNHYEERAKYQADIGILVKHETGQIIAANLNGRDIKDQRRIGRSYGLEQKIRSMYACGTKIIIDETEVITSVGDY